jgi:hypothetical protein
MFVADRGTGSRFGIRRARRCGGTKRGRFDRSAIRGHPVALENFDRPARLDRWNPDRLRLVLSVLAALDHRGKPGDGRAGARLFLGRARPAAGDEAAHQRRGAPDRKGVLEGLKRRARAKASELSPEPARGRATAAAGGAGARGNRCGTIFSKRHGSCTARLLVRTGASDSAFPSHSRRPAWLYPLARARR